MDDQQGQPRQWVSQNPYQQPPYSQPQYQSPSLYNQPTQGNSGQFQQSPYNNFQPPRKRTSLGGWYKSRTRKMKLGIGCGTIIAVLLFFTCIGTAIGSRNLAPTPTPTAPSGQAAVISSPTPTRIPSPTPVPTHKPTLTPTHEPTPTPTPKPTSAPTHAPQPTQPPHTPTPCPGINCNPWGYNFSPGNLIYYPPANFCSYFSCITSFQEPDDPGDGYIVQCADNLFSQSGGERGACSYHGGVQRPLYSL